jgi:cysteine desulfurase/selenocysteine lyase
MGFNVEKIRKDFPILGKKVNGKPIVYLDNACMTLRPMPVIDKINEYYTEYPACGGRSHHKLSMKVSEEVAKARKALQNFFGAKKEEEIVFTKNTTEAINLVSHSLKLEKGDVIIQTDKEHSSNLVPWQMMKEKGVVRKVVMGKKDNTFDLDAFEAMVGEAGKDLKLVSMVHTSNLDGTTIPAKEMIKIAHDHGALVLLDGAQSAPHKDIDVRQLDVDFFACSGHKMLGPSGIGMLYAKQDLLEKLPPFITGGETIHDSTYDSFELEKPPAKFEAGLQHYAGIIGFGAAVEYLKGIGMANIEEHELELNKKITESALALEGIRLIGPEDPALRAGIFNFNIEGMDPHNVAIMSDEAHNVMLRSGAHCVHSWFNAHNMKGSVRASLYLYNTLEECDTFIESLKDVLKLR